MGSPFLRIGTRGSSLALWQARAVQAALAAEHKVGPEEIEIVTIRTTGDQVRDRSLADLGGKGLFTKEIEEALIDGRVDVAVHSAKDVPTFLPDGLVLAACLPRADVRDALIAPGFRTLDALPKGAVVGTASVRRSALLKSLRPDIETVLLRGNVETRLRKLDEGIADATLLALAGLKRLGLAEAATAILDVGEFLPAVGQGAIGIETRADDSWTRELLAPINHADTFNALACERAFLAVLDGSCRTPIGGHATIASGRIRFRGMIIKPDGSEAFETTREGDISDAEKLGADAGAELKGRGGPDFFAH
jgi:hydroxymethylbilane synthase